MTTQTLPVDPDSLTRYKCLRPSWKSIAEVTGTFVVSQENAETGTITGVSDGYWFLVGATLPDEAREIAKRNAESWSGYGEGVKEKDVTWVDCKVEIGRRILLAHPVALRTWEKKVSASGYNDVLIFRTSVRDIAVNPRKARWVEKWGDYKGQWYADAESPHLPLRYVVDGKIAGLLMPLKVINEEKLRKQLGLEYDRETERFRDAGK
jgi:hypothetical protein